MNKFRPIETPSWCRRCIMMVLTLFFFITGPPQVLSKEKAVTFEKVMGGADDDEAFSIIVKKNGGYIVAGYTSSKGKGGADGWVLAFSEKGEMLWEKTYGTVEDEKILDVQQTKEGGYVLAGVAYTGEQKGNDAWIVKTDLKGEITWEKYFGRSGNDIARSIRQTRDGGFIVAGSTEALSENSTDLWIIKLDSFGNFQWEKLFGGKSYDEGYSIQQTAEGGYIVAGSTQSKGAGGFDLWVLKLNQSGEIIWEKLFGGEYTDEGRSVQQTSDAGYIIAGYNDSKTGGYRDAWVLKLDNLGKLKWEKNLGGINVDQASCIRETDNGDFLVAGSTSSRGAGMNDLWVFKLDDSGKLLWERTYGGKDEEMANALAVTPDEGCIVAGFTESKGAGGKDLWVLKLDKNGLFGK